MCQVGHILLGLYIIWSRVEYCNFNCKDCKMLQCEKLQLTVEPFIVILADFLLRLGLRRASMKYLYKCSPV